MPDDNEKPDEPRRTGTLELILTVIVALAAVGTAWAGFQSTKWGGVQANSYASAAATRVESSRLSDEAGTLVTLDVITFTEWLSALNTEIATDPSARPDGAYQPEPGTLSAFIHQRFRDEFRPAVDAWLATRPLQNPDAPRTPFQMDEYRLASQVQAGELRQRADQLSATARTANQRSDNYVLLTVMFALVLFFSALGGKTRPGRSRGLLLALSVVTLVMAVGVLMTFPVEI